MSLKWYFQVLTQAAPTLSFLNLRWSFSKTLAWQECWTFNCWCVCCLSGCWGNLSVIVVKCHILVLVVLFKSVPGKLLFESSEREMQAFSSKLFQSGLGVAFRICSEWPSVEPKVTMWLNRENLLCLRSPSLRSLCTKEVLSQCPTSRFCQRLCHLSCKQIKVSA